VFGIKFIQEFGGTKAGQAEPLLSGFAGVFDVFAGKHSRLCFNMAIWPEHS